jgi:hypothetical protein
MLSGKMADGQLVECTIQIVAMQHFLGSGVFVLKDCWTRSITFLEIEDVRDP